MANESRFAYHPPGGAAYTPVGDMVPFEPKRRSEDRTNLPGLLTPEEFSAKLRANPILNPPKPAPVDPLEGD